MNPIDNTDSTDRYYMKMALELAIQGDGYVSPNPMVGAVVVNAGQVVGQGYHQAVGGPHAEVHALDAAGERAHGATLYVTLEPCNHFGRTPPCTQKILAAGIQRVVVAMADPNPDVTGGGNAYLQSKGVEVVTGLCEIEARKLNERFVKYTRSKKPFVVLKMAATLDGRIATHSGDARWVTGSAARQKVHAMRHAMDAILVGVGTVKADDPQLTTRLEGMKGVDPTRIVLDTHLTMPETARMLQQSSMAETWIICGPNADPGKKELLCRQGAVVLECPVQNNRIDLASMLTMIGARGVTSVLIEGGGRVAHTALTSGVVDKCVLFYALKLLGGSDGIPMFNGPGPEKMSESLVLYDTEVIRMDEDIMITGYLRADH